MYSIKTALIRQDRILSRRKRFIEWLSKDLNGYSCQMISFFQENSRLLKGRKDRSTFIGLVVGLFERQHLDTWFNLKTTKNKRRKRTYPREICWLHCQDYQNTNKSVENMTSHTKAWAPKKAQTKLYVSIAISKHWHKSSSWSTDNSSGNQEAGKLCLSAWWIWLTLKHLLTSAIMVSWNIDTHPNTSDVITIVQIRQNKIGYIRFCQIHTTLLNNSFTTSNFISINVEQLQDIGIFSF